MVFECEVCMVAMKAHLRHTWREYGDRYIVRQNREIHCFCPSFFHSSPLLSQHKSYGRDQKKTACQLSFNYTVQAAHFIQHKSSYLKQFREHTDSYKTAFEPINYSIYTVDIYI